MKPETIELVARDPIVCRDGRPFGRNQGNRMRSTPWPMPSVVAGSLRTALGKSAGRGTFSDATAADLLRVAVGGIFPAVGEQLYLPAPDDGVVARDNRLRRARPAEHRREGGCDWPADGTGLLPVMLDLNDEEDDFKPKESPAWWPLDRLVDWLIGEDVTLDDRFLGAPRVDERTHGRINPDTGANQVGELFTTEALSLTHLPRYGGHGSAASWSDRFQEIGLVTRAWADGWAGEALAGLDMLHPLGGERRLVRWKAGVSFDWSCPARVKQELGRTRRVRMVLATPAIFRDGWKPGWLREGLTGSPPEGGPRLRLVGFTIRRWRAVSGWSLAHPRGPKPIKRIVPAGGVYFFEVDGEPNAARLADTWLVPVSDDEQDRRDGFGLAVWGTWSSTGGP